MSVEVECYRVKRHGEDVLEHSLSISPGDSTPITYLDQIRLLTFCDNTDSVGSVWIGGNNPGKHISVILYENEDDDEGKPIFVDSDLPIIRITKGQELYIFSRRKPRKEVFICLESDNDEGEKITTDSPEKSRLL